jgi:hypothetical protein
MSFKRIVVAVGSAQMLTLFVAFPLPASAQLKAAAVKSESEQQAARNKVELERCKRTWDPSTQMSRQEWATTCKRMVKDPQGWFNKPF